MGYFLKKIDVKNSQSKDKDHIIRVQVHRYVETTNQNNVRSYIAVESLTRPYNKFHGNFVAAIVQLQLSRFYRNVVFIMFESINNCITVENFH